MNHRTTILLLAGALVSASFHPSSASACSSVVCRSPRLVAGSEVVAPANVPGFAVDLSGSFGAEPETFSVQLVEVSSGEPVVVPSAFIDGMVVPLEGLVDGSVYELEMITICGDEPIVGTATIFVIETASFPETLGQVFNVWAESAGQVPVPESGGSCYSTTLAAFADVAVELDESAEPWADLLVWETLVDGVPYAPSGTYSPENPYGLPGGYVNDPAGSWLGRGIDRVYTACGEMGLGTSDEGVSEGPHEVTFVAHIPGTDIVLESGLARIGLDCRLRAYPDDVDCLGGTFDYATGMCLVEVHDDFCADGYSDPSDGCPDYDFEHGEWDEGGWFFGCSATGGVPASRGGAVGFAFLMLGAVLTFRRRRG